MKKNYALMVLFFLAQQAVAQTMSGGWHTMILCDSNTVYGSGWNGNGALGLGSTATEYSPVLVSGLQSIKAVVSGTWHTAVLKYDGTVWGSGDNSQGQLGDSSRTTRNSFVQARISDVTAISANGPNSIVYLKNDGTVWYSGKLADALTFDSIPVQITGIDSVIAIARGGSHVLMLRQDSTVWAIGSNDLGQLGTGNFVDSNTPLQIAGLSQVKAIAAGSANSFFVKSDGTVWACGYNEYGQLGDSTTTNRANVIQITSLSNIKSVESSNDDFTLFLKNDGTVYSCGTNFNGQLGNGTTSQITTSQQTYPNLIAGISDVKEVAVGAYVSFFRKNDNSIWGVGANNTGSLGADSLQVYTVPVNAYRVCYPTAVKELADVVSYLSVYPNPTGSILNIETAAPTSVAIFNGLGQIMITEEIDRFKTVDLTNFVQGIYFVKDVKTNRIIRFVKL